MPARPTRPSAPRPLCWEPLEERAVPAGGTIGTALLVSPTPGHPVVDRGTISNAAPVDMYRIDLGPNQSFSVRVTAESLGGLDGFLRLFKPDGTELGFSQDYAGADPALLVQFPPPGTYYVGLSATGNPEYDPLTGESTPNFSNGPFEITFSIDDEAPDTANNTLAGAEPVTVDPVTGTVVSGRISAPADRDLYAITLTGGQGLTATAEQADSQFDGYLRVFDVTGRELAANDDFDGIDPAIGFVAPADGVYFVGVSQFPNKRYDPLTGAGGRAVDHGGDYRLRLSVADGSPDGNDTLATATPVTVNTGQTVELQASVLGRSDVDVYAVALTAGDVLAIEVTAASRDDLDGYLRLFDAAGNEVGYNDDASATDPGQRLYAPADGVYYVAVSGIPVDFPDSDYDPTVAGTQDSDSFGPYSLRLTRGRAAPDGNDTLATAAPLAWRGNAEQTAPGEIAHTRDIDLFALDLPAGATVLLDIDARFYSSPLDSYLRVFGADGAELAANGNRNDDTRDSGLVFTTPAAGRYFVGVSSFAAGDDYDPTDPLAGDRQPSSVEFYNLRYTVVPPAPAGSTSLTPGGVVTGTGPTVFDFVVDGPGRFTARATATGAAPLLTLSGPDAPLLTSAGTADGSRAEVSLHLTRGRYQLSVGADSGFRLATQFDPASDPLGAVHVGLDPSAVATGDFDGDGHLDVVTANYNSGTASVLLGLGGGTFRPRTDLVVGGAPSGVVAADLDGDGFTDLAVAGEEVKLFFGRGDGKFGAPVDLAIGQPFQIARGDLNGDGRPDLVVSRRVAPGGVTVALNNGGRNFTVGPLVPFAEGARTLAVADLNGDGRADVAAALVGESFLPGTVALLLGDGTGALVPGARLGTGRELDGVVAADLDGDGVTDLAVVNGGLDDNVWVLRGTGAGAFVHTATLPVGHAPLGLEVGDLNGDGRPDLVTVDSNSHTLSVLVNRGGGTFAPARQVGSMSFPEAVAIGDADGDGRPDLIAADAPSVTSQSQVGDGEDRVYVFLGRGDGTFRDGVGPDAVRTPAALAVGDLNRDGFADSVVTNNGDGTVSVLISNGDGTFRDQVKVTVGDDPVAVVLADFNRDGRPDVAVTVGDTDVVVLLGIGDGTFTRGVRVAVPGGANGLAVADFNRDGFRDLAAVGEKGLTLLTGDGNGGFTPGRALPVGAVPVGGFSGIRFAWVAAADFDGDGAPDVATVLDGDQVVRLFRNDGTGRLTPAGQTVVGPDARGAAPGDFDRDGITDLAIVDERQGTLTVLRGTRTGFVASAPVAAGASPEDVVAVDLNGDNLLDLAVAAFRTQTGEYLSVLSGRGDGTFGAAAAFDRGDFALYALAAGDVNGDGAPDLVTADFGADAPQVLLNTSSGLVRAGDGFVNEFRATPIVSDITGDGTPDLASVTLSGRLMLRRGLPGRPGVFDSPVLLNSTFPVRDVVAVPGTSLFAAVPIRQGRAVYVFDSARPNLAPVSLLVNDLPVRITVGDLNGDEYPDLVVAGIGGGVTVFRGVEGAFVSAAELVTGADGPAGLAVTDADGRPGADILVLSQVSGVVTLLPNLGDFQFSPARPYRGTTGTSGVDARGALSVRSPDRPAALTVGTLSPGGPTGAVVLSGDADRFALLLQNGTGLTNPVAQPDWTTGRKPVALASTDLNGDGWLDLVVLNQTDATLSVFLGGPGGFAAVPGARTPIGPGAVGLTVADLSGPGGAPDGIPDVVIGNDFGDMLFVVGNGDGTFRPFVRSDQRVPLAVTDINGDGVPDVVLADQARDAATGRTRVPGTGSFSPSAFQRDGSNGLIGPGDVTVADLNGDGRDDLVFANTGSNNVLVYLRQANGTFADRPLSFFAGTGPAALTVTQLNDDNGDGAIDARDLIDVVVANQGSNDASVLFGNRTRDANGDGTFDDGDLLRPGPRLQTGGSGPNAVTATDVNGDGIADLLMTNGQSGTLTAIPGIGSNGVGTGFFNDTALPVPLSIAPGPVLQTRIVSPTQGLALGADGSLWQFSPQLGGAALAFPGTGGGVAAFDTVGAGAALRVVLALNNGSVTLLNNNMTALRTVTTGLAGASDVAVVRGAGGGFEVYLSGLLAGAPAAAAVSSLFASEGGGPVVVVPTIRVDLQAVGDPFALVATLLTGLATDPAGGGTGAGPLARAFDPFATGRGGGGADDVFLDDDGTVQSIGAEFLARVEGGPDTTGGAGDSTDGAPDLEPESPGGRLRRWLWLDGALERLIHPDESEKPVEPETPDPLPVPAPAPADVGGARAAEPTPDVVAGVFAPAVPEAVFRSPPSEAKATGHASAPAAPQATAERTLDREAVRSEAGGGWRPWLWLTAGAVLGLGSGREFVGRRRKPLPPAAPAPRPAPLTVFKMGD